MNNTVAATKLVASSNKASAPGTRLPTPQSQQKQHTLGDLDVLCGRGRVAQNLVGNQRFHTLIRSKLETYVNQRSKQDKSILIKTIASHCVTELGFRFLKKSNNASRKKLLQPPNQQQSSKASSAMSHLQLSQYVTLEDAEIYDKVGHALRDLAIKKYGTVLVHKDQVNGNSKSKKSTKASSSKKHQKKKDSVGSTPVVDAVQSSTAVIDGSSIPTNLTRRCSATSTGSSTTISSTFSNGSNSSSSLGGGDCMALCVPNLPVSSSIVPTDDKTTVNATWIDDSFDHLKVGVDATSGATGVTNKKRSIVVLDTFAEQYLSELAIDMNVETSVDEPLPIDFSDLIFL